jgi:hypothetical protein
VEGKAGLADASRPGESEQPYVGALEKLAREDNLVLTPD